jgi:hypothetical protein
MNYARAETTSSDHAAGSGAAVMPQQWWESRWFWLALTIASTIPLWWPTLPPLVDLPGHLARYRVQLELGSSESLQRYFSFHWALIGNLGIDLLIIPLAPIFGLEGAVKLIVLTIPALTVGGIYWITREVHGRIPPTAIFAVPFIYNFPFIFGFSNFSLSMGLAFIALGAWLHLSAREKWRLRTAVFVPVSCLLWLVHAFGWAFLLLTAWSAELVRRHDSGSSFIKSAFRAGVDCLILCVPLLPMIAWRSGAPSGGTGGFFGIKSKIFSLAAVLRDRWMLWDNFSAAVAFVVIGSAIFDKVMTFSRKLALPAAVLAITFFVMPANIFGSAYADMRLAPFMLILGVCAVRFRHPHQQATEERLLAILAVAFFAARLAGSTLSFAIAERDFRAHTQALDFIPNGSRVLSLVGDSCGDEWAMPRHSHLGSLVIERKRGFSNDQWRLPGTQLLQIHYLRAATFETDPSEHVYPLNCLKEDLVKMKRDRALRRQQGKVGRFDKWPLPLANSADRAILTFPQWAFDYVWVVKAPDFRMVARPGLIPIWRDHDSVLYRIDPWWARATTPHPGNLKTPPEPAGTSPAR